MAGPGSFLPPVVGELMLDITEWKAGLAEARGEATAMADHGSSKFTQMATVGKAAWLGLGVVAVGVAVAGVEAADKWEGAHARLETAVHNSGSTWEAWGGTVDKAEGSAEKLGFTNTTVENSLAKLVPVTTSQRQATDLLSLAEDVARGRHMDLETATQLLVKVQTGHVSLLGRLGINTKDATGATISQEEAVRKLTDLYGGNASRYADTFAGKLQVVGAEAEDTAKNIGVFLIPAGEELIGTLADGTSWLIQNKDAAIALGVVVGGPLAASMAVYAVKEAQIVGGKLLDFWLSAASGARSFGVSVLYTTGVMDSAHDALIAKSVALEAGTVAESEYVVALGVTADAEANLAVAQQELFAAQYEATFATNSETTAQYELMAAQVAEEDATLALAGAKAAEVEANAALIASNEALLASEEEVAAATAVEAAPLLLVAAGVAAVVGVAYLAADALGYWDDSVSKSTVLGEKWADAQIKGITTTHNVVDSYREIKKQHDLVGASLTDEQKRYDALTGALVQHGNNSRNLAGEMQAGMIPTLDRLTAEHDRYGAALKRLEPDYEKQIKAQKDMIVQTQVMATSLGVTIPGLSKMTTQEQKAIQSAVAASSAEFNEFGTQVMLNMHVSSDAMQATVKDAQTFASSVASSVAKATDPFSHFSGQAVVSESDFEQFFVGSSQKAQAWSTELAGIITRIKTDLPVGARDAVTGLVQEMAKAGPDSQPALDAFVQMVDTHGVAWVNDWEQGNLDAQHATDEAFNSMAIIAAVKSAEMATVAKAALYDMSHTGAHHLQDLASSTNADLAQMAVDAATYTGQMNVSIDGVRTWHQTVFTGDDSQLRATIDDALGALAQVPDSTAARVAANLLYQAQQHTKGGAHGLVAGAHGLVGLARGGSAGMLVGPNEPVVIGEGLSREAVVPYDNYGDMVTTIRNTGRARDFYRAAADAAGMGFTAPSPGAGDGGGDGALALVGAAVSSGNGGGGEVHEHYHFHIAGSVVTERQLIDLVQEGVFKNGRQGRGPGFGSN